MHAIEESGNLGQLSSHTQMMLMMAIDKRLQTKRNIKRGEYELMRRINRMGICMFRDYYM